jgi:hypothetical protein
MRQQELKAERDDAGLDKAELEEVNIPSVRIDSPIVACQFARCCTWLLRSIVYYCEYIQDSTSCWEAQVKEGRYSTSDCSSVRHSMKLPESSTELDETGGPVSFFILCSEVLVHPSRQHDVYR